MPMPDDITPSAASRRTYQSPLRERQALQTRDEILDALTELLAHQRADEVNTKDLARAAGVSERTVYRHFADRLALVEGLTDRLAAFTGGSPSAQRLEDIKPIVIKLMQQLEAHYVEARAEALLNADPRRYTETTRDHTREFREAVAVTLPELNDDQLQAVAALVRVLVSAQTWLRMREEFNIAGDTAGPIVAWAIDALMREVQRGNPPPSR